MKKCNTIYILSILFSLILSQNYTLSGFITDSRTGESIPGANAYYLILNMDLQLI